MVIIWIDFSGFGTVPTEGAFSSRKRIEKKRKIK